MCPLGYIEGLYGKYPRIDKSSLSSITKELSRLHAAWVPSSLKLILEDKIMEAEEELKWWVDLFDEDYYIELQRHKIPDQEK